MYADKTFITKHAKEIKERSYNIAVIIFSHVQIKIFGKLLLNKIV